MKTCFRVSRFLLINLVVVLSLGTAMAQTSSDHCHVYVVDVEKARKALADFRPTGNREADMKQLSGAQTIFPEFQTAIGEEILTTKTFQFPGSELIITASVYYTDESMASARGVDSMQVGIVISPKAHKNALIENDSSIAELTLNGKDTVRVKRYFTVKSRLYLVGLECRSRETKK